MTYFQLIIDVVFFVTVLFLIWQLDRKIGKQRSSADRKSVLILEELMARSQEQTDQFLTVMEEREQRFNKWLRQLDNQEKKFVMLIEEVRGLSEELEEQRAALKKDARLLAECGGDAFQSKEHQSMEQRAALKKDDGLGAFTDSHAPVLQLIRQGLSPEEVARRSNMTEGEVNLIVALSQTPPDRS